MPRTKVSKSSKRNREAANREEKVREFENTLEGFQNTYDIKVQEYITSYEQQFKLLLQRANTAMLQMKICDLFEMDLMRFNEWEQKSKLLNAQNSSLSNSTLLTSTKATNPNDEGYLTEDSSTSGSLGSSITNAAFLNASNMRSQQLVTQQTARLRTPGPLSSARARRPRRSRSACGDYVVPGSAIKSKSSSQQPASAGQQGGGEHNARSKMRTPMARTKALSADRTSKVDFDGHGALSPPTFLRFPKPGELVLSKCGSPLVANTLPDKFAHLNIPLRNGVISMRPKKLAELQPDILEAMDRETLDQLRTLHANIDKIVSMADKAGFL